MKYMIGFVIALVLIVILLISFVLMSNRIVQLNNQVNQAFGSIDIYLQKRFDLIPNLISILKEYLEHEKEILMKVSRVRNQAIDSDEVNKRVVTSNQFNTVITQLSGQIERYPNLKSNSQFAAIQYELEDIEHQISASRRAYNAAVNDYNTAIESFPHNIVARIRKNKTKDQLEILQSN